MILISCYRLYMNEERKNNQLNTFAFFLYMHYFLFISLFIIVIKLYEIY